MAYTQDTRGIGIETPLGKDVLLLQGFNGSEGISRLFRFELALLSENRAVDFEQLVGKNVTVMMKAKDDVRYFNGIISRFSQAGSGEKFAYYRAEMVPWLWMLTRTADCRIFQNKSVPDIVQQIFTELGFQDFKNNLQKSYPPREFVVQYRETDFNFVSRLLEHAGIFYYFQHENGKHTLVLGDTPAEHQPGPQPQVRFHVSQGAVATNEDVVTGWATQQGVRSAAYALTDFNFETPSTNLAAMVDSVFPPPGGNKFEVYDYPGEYLKKAEGDELVKLRMEEEEAQRLQVEGKSSVRTFASGYRFDLTEHYRSDQNQPYVLVAITHSISEDSYTTGADTQTSYSNTFSAIPLSVPFRPPRTTPRPIVQGPQTAIVVGKPGEELWVDKYGRIKVQFHWDREGKSDENSSCWIRLAQNWAGKRWGAVFLPRVGQEVIVEFLEGNPDTPIVTGSVYNGEMGTPYNLPADQTKTAIRSNSSKGGGGANEIRFEDKKGSEQIYIHSEKDLDFVVKSTARERVGGQKHVVVGGTHFEEFGGDAHQRIVGEEIVSVEKNATKKIGGDLIEDIKGSHSAKAGQEIAVKAGMKIVVDAGMEITLKGAGGFIKIDPSGVTIQGTLVRINSGGAPGTAGPVTLKPVKTPSGAGSAPAGGAGKLEGFDWAKLNDPNHKTTKYNFGRVAMQYTDDLSGVTDKKSAEDLLASMKDDMEANGVPVLDVDGDKIQTIDPDTGKPVWVDVIRGSGSGDPAFQWGPLDAADQGNVKGGGLARHGLTSGVPAGQPSRMGGAAAAAKSAGVSVPGVTGAMPSNLDAGFNPAKLADLSHQTPKYQFARVAQNYDLSKVKDKATAEALLTQMKPQLEANGVKVLGIAGDKIQTIDPGTGQKVWVDVIKGAGSGNPFFSWMPGE